jgi:DNA helicase IV
LPDIASEIAHEQGVVDTLYSRLDELRQVARSRLAEVRRVGPSGSPQNRSERDAFATLYEERAARLDAVEDRLVFGRLDLRQPESEAATQPAPIHPTPGTPATAHRYIGRLALSDDEHHPMLTDWRAPAAEPFYRATALEPGEVIRRRHVVTSRRTVTSIEDELLDLDHADTAGTLSGEGALLASLAERRTGHMTDIVATIQAEQDRIIRSALHGALVVQGGPGTGKTAVALHRAAYLLYAHRATLERSGVLLVGPSRAFLRYIDQVLPSLGETGVVSTTIGELLPGVTARGTDHGQVAELKGRAVWADILRRAVRARERIPAEDSAFHLDGHTLHIRRRDIREAMSRARRTHKPHNEARAFFVRDMLSRLVSQYATVTRTTVESEDRAILLEDLRGHRDVRIALNIAWFPLSSKRLVDDLFAKPHRLVEAAEGAFTQAELRALYREKWAPWTESDIPLLDEAAELLGDDDSVAQAENRARAAERSEALKHAREVIASGATAGAQFAVDAQTLADRFVSTGPRLTTAERAAKDRRWTYGHVVVDEAQELSPMAWRMMTRRVPTRSMTIVGDVAQTSSFAGAQSWAEMLDPVCPGGWRINELTVSYRTPATVANAAQRMARAAGLPISPLTAARELPDAMLLRAIAPEQVIADVCAQVGTLVPQFVGRDGGGRVAVIAAADAVDAVRDAVQEALPGLVGDGEARRISRQRPEDRQVTVVSPWDTKGLEYDAVVLVEPADIARTPSGWSDLYVSMTRPTQRLVVVHAQPLPQGFEDGAWQDTARATRTSS